MQNQEQRGKVNPQAADLKDIECFVLDMDGTINLGERLIDGAKEYIEFMQEKACRFISLPTILQRRRWIMSKNWRGLAFPE